MRRSFVHNEPRDILMMRKLARRNDARHQRNQKLWPLLAMWTVVAAAVFLPAQTADAQSVSELEATEQSDLRAPPLPRPIDGFSLDSSEYSTADLIMATGPKCTTADGSPPLSFGIIVGRRSTKPAPAGPPAPGFPFVQDPLPPSATDQILILPPPQKGDADFVLDASVVVAAGESASLNLQAMDLGAGWYDVWGYCGAHETWTGRPISVVGSLPLCDGFEATVVASPGALLVGSPGRDVIVGTDGPDVIWAGDGDDLICAGAGDDVILGQGGSDVIIAGDGDDRVHGGSGADRIEGNGGNDRLLGGASFDALLGGDGDDHISGGTGQDYANGGDGADAVNGGKGADVLHGGNDKDTVRGGPGNDHASGGKGDSIVYGGRGDDFLLGEVVSQLSPVPLPIPVHEFLLPTVPVLGTVRGGPGDDLLTRAGACFGGAGNNTFELCNNKPGSVGAEPGQSPTT